MVDPSFNGDDLQDAKIASLRNLIADCEKALEYLNDPRFKPIYARYQQIVSDYDLLLHNVNVDERTRDRAAHAVDVGGKFLNIRRYFEYRMKQAKSDLAVELGIHKSEAREHDFSFMR